MANWNGQTIGKVQIGELLARGGMAEVYIGEHTTLGRKVAVKIMHDHIESDPENRARFEREARVIASLRHPNVIQIFDCELAADGRPCIVMELISGASLGTYLKALHKNGEKLPHSTIARILSELSSAIDYAHSQNIIHRDLKPANVLLRAPGENIDINQPLPNDVEPILTDFGLVRVLDSTVHTATGMVSGTPAYMSPEQARGDNLDFKTDIYSLGVMLYEMLAGAVPFESESSFGVLMKHLNEPPPSISGISPNIQVIIDRALAKDSAIRYSSAKELSDDFAAALRGESISTHTLNLAKIARSSAVEKKTRLFNWKWALASAAILFGAIFSAYLFFGKPPLTANSKQPIGRVSYLDFNNALDKATITFAALPPLEAGSHYEAWYLAQGGETRRNIGSIEINGNGQGQLVFIHPEMKNILASFDQLEVTIEPNNDPAPDEPSKDVVASSVFPPLAFIHVRHLLVAFDPAPKQIALIQGLWTSADDLHTNVVELQKAFKNKDEALIRKKTEEIINRIVGRGNITQHADWNKDGAIDNPSDGFGLLKNSEQGYIPQTISHAKFAAQSLDATDNIQTHGAYIIVCAENINGWSQQLLEKSLQLQKTPFTADMETLIVEMNALSIKIVSGADSNNNGIIEPIVGEGGADTAYEHAYSMADMPLFTGAHSIPPPATNK